MKSAPKTGAWQLGWLSRGEEPVHPGWELTPPLAGALPVKAEGPLAGIYPAGSGIADREALGGFGPCDNYPRNLGDKDWGTQGQVSVVAFPEEPILRIGSLRDQFQIGDVLTDGGALLVAEG